MYVSQYNIPMFGGIMFHNVQDCICRLFGDKNCIPCKVEVILYE